MSDDQYPGDEVFDKIEALCDKAEYDIERGKPRAALKRFEKALNLLPEPQTQYPAGTYILLNMGNIYYEMSWYDKAEAHFLRALDFFEGGENPFIHLRLGQTYYELGKMEQARGALQCAWDLEGVTIYEGEDPKYLTFIQQEQ